MIEKIDTSWMKPKTKVWYMLGGTEYAGEIIDVFQCGNGGRLVARLSISDTAYKKKFGLSIHSIAELKFLRKRS